MLSVARARVRVRLMQDLPAPRRGVNVRSTTAALYHAMPLRNGTRSYSA